MKFPVIIAIHTSRFYSRSFRKYQDDKYGDLDKTDIEKLDKQLEEPFDPSEPFGTFIKRIEDIMEVAEVAGYAYTPNQIIHKAFNLIEKS